MMFNREALLYACRLSLENHRVAWEQDQTARKQAYTDSQTEWMQTYARAWRDACEAIVYKLDNGEPIVERDLPQKRGSWHSVAVFDVRGGEPKPGEYQAPQDTLALIAVLEAVTDEKISTNGLKELGFGQRLLARITPLLRAASQ